MTALLTITEAAQRLRVSRSRLYVLLGEDALPTVRIGSRRLVREADLDAFIDAHTA